MLLTLGKAGRAAERVEVGGVEPVGGSNRSDRSLAEPGEKGESRSMSTGDPGPATDLIE